MTKSPSSLWCWGQRPIRFLELKFVVFGLVAYRLAIFWLKRFVVLSLLPLFLANFFNVLLSLSELYFLWLRFGVFLPLVVLQIAGPNSSFDDFPS